MSESVQWCEYAGMQAFADALAANPEPSPAPSRKPRWRGRAVSRRQVESAALQLAARSQAFDQAAGMLAADSAEARRLTRRAVIARAASHRLGTAYARLCKAATQVSVFWRRLRDAFGSIRKPTASTMTVQRPPAADRMPVEASGVRPYVLDIAPDANEASDTWCWRIEGTAISFGSIFHALVDEGLVRAEAAGDAVNWLLQHGPFWDLLDTDEEFTISIKPAGKAAE